MGFFGSKKTNGKKGCGCKSCNHDSDNSSATAISIGVPIVGSRLDFGVTGLEGYKESKWRSPMDGNDSIDVKYMEYAVTQGGSGKYYCKMKGSPPKICKQEGQPTGANCDPLPPVGDQACYHGGRLGKITNQRSRGVLGIFGLR